MEPAEFTALCQGAKTVWHTLGRVDCGRKSSEMGNVKFRRSLYFVRDLKVGDIVTPDAVRSVGPDAGLPPKHHSAVVGNPVAITVSADTPASWQVLGIEPRSTA
ncbi:SAF domain-containing protein [Shinella sp. CPCC 101442]|uniref:SAF domain-containing protein n=1 Tax=Shinella sp. CPCC 101442 TaxID=2932265 RepID=UPI002152E60C|nr:SAF domain-containing protein [Shinella sp. CPCC 101442]